jgi:hypothetical protein
MKKPKVLLGTPTYQGKEYCLDYWVKIVKAIQKESNCDIIIIDNSKTDYYSNLIRKKYKLKVIKSKHYSGKPITSLAESRKLLYKYAIKNQYDFLFSLEQDVFPPSDIIEHFLKIRKEIKAKETIIGAPYAITNVTDGKKPYVQKDKLTSVALKRIYSRRMKRKIQDLILRKQMLKRKKVFKVHATGFGCALIDVSILKKVKIRYSEKSYRPDDALLFIELEKIKIPVYADPLLMDKVIHIEGNIFAASSWGKDSKGKNN